MPEMGLVPFSRSISFHSLQETARTRKPNSIGFLFSSFHFEKVLCSSHSHTNYKNKSPVLSNESLIFMVPEMGLEPTHLSAYAPQAYVSTIPPPGQGIFTLFYFSN